MKKENLTSSIYAIYHVTHPQVGVANENNGVMS